MVNGIYGYVWLDREDVTLLLGLKVNMCVCFGLVYDVDLLLAERSRSTL